MLEGGYAASGLREGADAVLDGILGADPPEPPKTAPVLSGSVLEQAIGSVLGVHGSKFSTIAAS